MYESNKKDDVERKKEKRKKRKKEKKIDLYSALLSFYITSKRKNRDKR